ncbi:MAG: hypothetical protein H7Y86_02885 [Rhizobacter sp.]|nr:hypothetical protein [Ferruginibacter sp.]
MSVFILLAILATDIILHKGMSRVIIPEKFTSKRLPQQGFPKCDQVLDVEGKHWIKAVNTITQAKALDSSTNGIEMDVYFDTTENTFFVYHDSAHISHVQAAEIFSALAEKKQHIPIWLDFKNLAKENQQPALAHLTLLKNNFHLEKKLLVESSDPSLLQLFCDSGFFTSYYVPFFNPYQEKEDELIQRVDEITALLKKYPVSALSGYYFQMPFLKRFFPAFPVLTWTDDSKVSIINTVFNRRLEKDEQVHIILHNIED